MRIACLVSAALLMSGVSDAQIADRITQSRSIIHTAIDISLEAADILGRAAESPEVYKERADRMVSEFAKLVRTGDSETEIIEKLNEYFFRNLNFTADPAPKSDHFIENVLLHEVLDNRKGVCMSLSILYMGIAESVGLEPKGVSVPLHFFVRSGRETNLNIETLKQGSTDLTDEDYRELYFVEDWEPFYMESLDDRQVLSVFAANIASILTLQNHPANAVNWLEDVLPLIPDDVEVMTSLGNAHALMGDDNSAIEWWNRAVTHNRRDDKAHHSLAYAYYRTGQYAKAIEHFDESLRLGHEVDYPLLRALEWHREDSYYRKNKDVKEE